MNIKIPIKSLSRLSWMVALLMSGIVFLIQLHDKRGDQIMLYTGMTAFTVTSIAYFNIYLLVVLVKKYELNSYRFKLYRYLFSFLGSAFVYLVIWPVVIYKFTHGIWVYYDSLLVVTFISGSLLLNALLLMLHNTVLLYTVKVHADMEFSRLQASHAEAANLLLKQQIHPHFLFNALNTVKALYHTDLESGDTYLVHLARFLRASVYTHTAKVARLDQELVILDDYLQMQKIRFGAGLQCKINLPEQSLTNFYLPSFSLQPLLENAIKHNELTEQCPLFVTIAQHNDRIVIANNLQRKSIKTDSTNSGLANLAERYRLLSGDQVDIEEKENQFSVSIKLLSDEHSNHRR
ncbi:sensor histidine kinase [Dyadobacter subterraneus]|uniref:Histidine kinase n=1 Tax=Dyadobacter subterraneus TaxID=2773304 RepID=A0ABR9W957_9BACT|nr:histidine kinase [Dyadobacter subterraneus]MBE9461990.1 histidine kinase [Dyadobacter subterraneus]